MGGSIGGDLHIGNINGLIEEEAARLFDEILTTVEKKDFSGECPKAWIPSMRRIPSYFLDEKRPWVSLVGAQYGFSEPYRATCKRREIED